MTAARPASTSAIARPVARRAPRPAPTSPIGRTPSRAGVELRTRCRVREVTVDAHGMATGVIYYDAEGAEQFQAARDGDRGVQRRRHAAPAAELGLGPLPDRASPIRAGWSARNLMFHPFRAHLRLCRRAAGRQPRAAAQPVEPGILRGPTSAVASCAATRCSSIAAHGSITEAITSTIAGRLPWGEDHHRVYRRLLGHRLGMSTITEDLPEEHNRVTLDPVLKDSSGITRAQDRLHDRRQYAEDAGARHRPIEGHPGRGRRHRYQCRKSDPERRLASHGDSAHGH